MVVGGAFGGGGAASLGPTVLCFLFHVFLFGRPSRGLCLVVVHAQDPTMVAVVLRRASGSWCCLGSPLLNDDAMTPPRLANRLELPWRSSQSRFVLSFGTRCMLSFGARRLWMLLCCPVGFDTHAGAVR